MNNKKDRDMMYGYAGPMGNPMNTPMSGPMNPQMMGPNGMGNMGMYQPNMMNYGNDNNYETRLSTIERKLKNMEQRLKVLEGNTSNYSEPDNSMYMI